MADAMMMFLGEAHGVNWYWAQPGEFKNPGVYYWDGARNVLCVPHLSAPEAPAQGDPLEKLTRIQEELGLYDDKPAQGEFVHDPACKMCEGRGYYVAGYSGREDDGNATIHQECDCWIPNPEAPAHPSVPAPWREAVKVAREALATVQASVVEEGISAGRREYRSELFTRMAAALAQIDALEGGE